MVPDRDLVLEGLARSGRRAAAPSRSRGRFGLLELRLDHLVGGGLEHRGGVPLVQHRAGPAQLGLHDLAEVHARGNAQGVEHDVDRASRPPCTACPPAGSTRATTPLLPWRPAILSPSCSLRLAAIRTFTTSSTPGSSSSPFGALQALHVDDRALDAVGHAQGGVAHLLGLLAEDRVQQLELGGGVRLALRGDLAHEDGAGLHRGADADDALLVELLEGVLVGVGDVAGDLLGPELGLPHLDGELLDVDGGERVVLDDLLAR